jgi:hypothetical protein
MLFWKQFRGTKSSNPKTPKQATRDIFWDAFEGYLSGTAFGLMTASATSFIDSRRSMAAR